MTYRPSVAPNDLKRRCQGGDLALTKWFSGFDSRLVLGPGHTKDIKSGNDPCLHGTQHKGGTTKT